MSALGTPVGGTGLPPGLSPAPAFPAPDADMLAQVAALTSPDQPAREAALLELSKKREEYADLAPCLWYSFGTIATLLQEIVAIYPALSPPTLTSAASNRVCNALALLQCVASHTETRSLFLSAHIPLYLYPFLSTAARSKPFEYLRLTSLGVIGALVKMDDADVVSFLLQTEIIPLCLRIMETGSELSRTVATFIVQKILLDNVGLDYICSNLDRLVAVATVLAHMTGVCVASENPSHRLLKHIIRCYLRLADNETARDLLRQLLPEELRNNTFAATVRSDPTSSRWLQQLVRTVYGDLTGNIMAASMAAQAAGAPGLPAGAGSAPAMQPPH